MHEIRLSSSATRRFRTLTAAVWVVLSSVLIVVGILSVLSVVWR